MIHASTWHTIHAQWVQAFCPVPWLSSWPLAWLSGPGLVSMALGCGISWRAHPCCGKAGSWTHLATCGKDGAACEERSGGILRINLGTVAEFLWNLMSHSPSRRLTLGIFLKSLSPHQTSVTTVMTGKTEVSELWSEPSTGVSWALYLSLWMGLGRPYSQEHFKGILWWKDF